MLQINYYSHLLLHSKYSFIIKLVLLLVMYSLFYIDNTTDIAYCTTSKGKKLKKALEDIERLQQDNYCLFMENQELKLKSLLDPKFENSISFRRYEDIRHFNDRHYFLCSHQTEYEIGDGRILRYAGRKIGENEFQEIYYPPNHPKNGFQPIGEVIRSYPCEDKKETLWFSNMCTIS